MSIRETSNGPNDGRTALLLFGTILLVYLVSGTVFVSKPIPGSLPVGVIPGVQDEFSGLDCFSVNDSSAVISQSLSLLNDGDLSFRADEIPHMLYWQIAGVPGGDLFPLPAIDERLESWIKAGTIIPAKSFPQIVHTTSPNNYLNCFGIGGALASAPAFAVAQLWYGGLESQPDVLDRVAFSIGASFVAASCLFLFLTLRPFTTRGQAVVLTLAYGLGTCVYSTSSQGMWQHSASAFFLTLGLLAFSRLEQSRWLAVGLGVCMAMATLSRPTLGIVAAAIGLHLLVTDRRSFSLYALAGLPFALTLFGLNMHFFGSPWKFGQTVLVDHAEEKTGLAQIWQTPPWIGIQGLLISPSRGLFVYSPFLLAAVPGAVLAWRNRSWSWIRPLTLAIPLILFIESNHFDWWGGWSYGYRHLVDLTPALVAMIAPAAGLLFRRGLLSVVFVSAIAFSVAVQILGVTANDCWGWNARVGYRLLDESGKEVGTTLDEKVYRQWVSQPDRRAEYVSLNIDRVEHRDRLWSVSDSQIAHCLETFWQGLASRQSQMWNARQPYQRKLAEAYRNLALAYQKVGAVDTTLACLEWSVAADPSYQAGMLSLWELVSRTKAPADTIASVLQQRRIESPDDLAAMTYLGFLWIELGDEIEAIRVLEEVLRRSPKEFRQRFDQCARYLQGRIKEDVTYGPKRLVGGRLARVAAVLELYAAGRAAELQGELADAETHYRDAMDRYPSVPMTRLHLARVLLEQGKVKESEAVLSVKPQLNLDR